MAIDFSGFVILAQIHAGGRIVELFPKNGTGQTYTTDSGGGYLPYLVEVTIEVGLGMNTIVTMTLNPPFREAVELLESDLVDKGATLAVRFGYVGTPLVPWTYVTMMQPSVQFGDDVTVTLNGNGFGFVMGRTSADKVYPDEKRENAEDGPASVSPKEVIEEIAQKHSLKTIVDGASTIVANDALNEKHPTIVQSGFNDWQFIMSLAQNAGCYMWTEGDVLRVVPADVLAKQKPSRTFVYLPGSQKTSFSDVKGQLGDGVYPMYTFNVQTTSLWLPGVGRGVSATDIDPNSGEATDFAGTVEGSTTIGSKQNPSIPVDAGAQGPTAPADRTFNPDTEDGKKTFVSAREVSASSSLQKEVTDAGLMNIKAECSTPGIPFVLPGEQVQVKTGVTRFDGQYQVMKVTHVLGRGGYESSFELQRSGTPSVADIPETSGPSVNAEASNLSGDSKTVDVTPGGA
jgi:phage protein D